MFDLQSLGIEYGTLAMFVLLLGFDDRHAAGICDPADCPAVYPWLVRTDGGTANHKQGLFVCVILCLCLGPDVRDDGSNP